MSVLLDSKENNIVMEKDIFRFAATLFAENSELYSTELSQLQLIKCVYIENLNESISISKIIEELLRIYKYHISLYELITIINNNKEIFLVIIDDDEKTYKLTDKAYSETLDMQKNNIDSYIDTFIEFAGIKKSVLCKEAIHKYLYELMTSNINSYKILMFGKDTEKFKESELSVNISFLSDEELEYIHNFIEWENSEKNIALTNIVFSCLEYCMLINGDKPNQLIINNIRKREIYLDTNILFRAIGINGVSRQRVVTAFLKKCRQAKLKLIISHQTKTEFKDTIKYYLSEIRRYPRGNIFFGAYEQISDYKLFSFYEEWKIEHPDLSLRFFEMYIMSQYDLIVRDYEIHDDEIIPSKIYDSDNFKNKRNAYTVGIKSAKQEAKSAYISEDFHYSRRDSHDATVISYIELLRDETVEDKDIFFVSSDKILRYWDMDRKEREYPVVIYPSQLFLVLIKMCGRSDKDFDSFVSFINIRSYRKQLSAEKANIILSGISSITEDIQAQKLIVSSICNGEFQNVVNESNADQELYQKVKIFSQKYLEGELKEHKEAIDELKETTMQQQVEIDELKDVVSVQMTTIENQRIQIAGESSSNEDLKEKICSYAESKIVFKYRLKWFVFPVFAIILTIAFIVFVGLQFLFCDASWNLVSKLFDIISETTFGKNVDGYIAIVDGAVFAVLSSIVFPAFWVKPWDKENREQYKQEQIEKYIKKHKLM